MLKATPVLMILFSLMLAACSDNTAIDTKPVAKNSLSDADIMMVMHCAEMKMDECEKFEGITLNEEQIKQGCTVMPEMMMCEKKI
jgi:hypothetical protein